MAFLLQAIAAAFFFSTYQVLIKRAGLNWWATCALINCFSFVVAATAAAVMFAKSGGQMSLGEFFYRQDSMRFGLAAILTGAALGATAGLGNGMGHFFYQRIVATPVKDLSVLTVIIPMLCLIIGMGGAIAFNGEKMTSNKVAAMVAAGLAIWLAGRD